MNTSLFSSLPHAVQQYLHGIFDSIPQEYQGSEKEAMLDELATQYQTLINTRLLQAMTPEAQEGYYSLLQNSPVPNAVAEYLQQHIPHYQSVIEQATDEFSALYEITK